ncbi:subtype B tannase [Aquabacterium sp. OR-4]|uniref:subtype B tannase n=1 Tax=Aquabacterium sp. OR-4 TaxID=2978127 RepID=UPI0021B4AFE6|nr:subtype B tannase [Aquabacterium sp. OR-4]MDT7838025.1 subtype B tannase [Aquabacterium sp. OR-4]
MKIPFQSRTLALAAAALAGGSLIAGCNAGADSPAAAATPATTPSTTETAGPGVYDSQLVFDKTRYTTITVTLDGVATPVRWYREQCYVGKPMALAPNQRGSAVDNQTCGYQNLNIFVREVDAARHDNPILLNVNNAGWFASYQGGLNGWDGAAAITSTNYRGADIVAGRSYVSTSDTDKIGAALARGFVYINMASRSRGATAPEGSYSDGIYQGKAPAAIVDAKAAVRYLRLNDAVMPGNASRIVVNGTSGGGAQVTQLGATGDHADYLPYLKAIGAAGVDANGKSAISDSVYAVVAYCPIQDMGSADIAYEWMFNVLDTRTAVSADQKAGLIVDASGAELVRASNPDSAGSLELMNRFVAYQAGLGLKNDDGTALTSDNMLAALQTEFKKSASAHVLSGRSIVAYGAYGSTAANGVAGGSGTLYYQNDFVNVDAGGTVTYFNLGNYLKYVAKQARLKAVPSFDQVGQTPALAATLTADTTKAGAAVFGNYSGGESNLFGTAAQVYANFTEYGWNNNNGGDAINARQSDVGLLNTGYTWAANPQRDALLSQYRLINALAYIGKTDGIARHWRIRNGARDRDTSFTVAYNISRALKADAKVKTADFALHWDQGHAGNYDVLNAFSWIDARLAAGD